MGEDHVVDGDRSAGCLIEHPVHRLNVPRLKSEEAALNADSGIL